MVIIGYQATLVALKNCAPFTKCIIKIDGTPVDYAEELDLVMPMYNLMEYSSNYSEKKQKKQCGYGFILKMKQLILMLTMQVLIILNLLSIRVNYLKTQKLMEQTKFWKMQHLMCH